MNKRKAIQSMLKPVVIIALLLGSITLARVVNQEKPEAEIRADIREKERVRLINRLAETYQREDNNLSREDALIKAKRDLGLTQVQEE